MYSRGKGLNTTEAFPVVVMDYRRPLPPPVLVFQPEGLFALLGGLSVSENGFDRRYGVNKFGS